MGNVRTLLLAGSVLVRSRAGAESPVPVDAGQMVLVVGERWDAAAADLQRYTRDPSGWHAVGEKVRVAVGKHGMAWGRGLHGAQPSGPQKREGDNRAPAGVFRLRGAFGYEPLQLKMPYQQVTPTTECVDDASDAAYNTIVDTSKVARTWHSAETMRRRDELYRYGLYVDHNTTPIAPGSGSCVFMHVWSGVQRGTAGCTAMPMRDIAALVEWLDPVQTPVLVQLPRAEYERLRTKWSLPRQ